MMDSMYVRSCNGLFLYSLKDHRQQQYLCQHVYVCIACAVANKDSVDGSSGGWHVSGHLAVSPLIRVFGVLSLLYVCGVQ